jgi:hypothetical protein
VPLSKKILFEQLRDCSVTADIVDGEVVFAVTPNPVAVAGLIEFDGNADSI